MIILWYNYNVNRMLYIFRSERGKFMPIKYDKLILLLKEKGYTSYKIRKDKIIGQATWQKIQNGGDIDTRTIAKFCKLLDCQPGDLLEYTDELSALN